MKNIENAIEVTHMYKDFKRVYDKPSTLKERLVYFGRSKAELHHVLKDINLEIKEKLQGFNENRNKEINKAIRILPSKNNEKTYYNNSR